MNIFFTKSALTAVLLIWPIVTLAQSSGFVGLSTAGSFKIYVGAGENAYRVGKGVLVYVHKVGEKVGMSVRVLLACDGSWISDEFAFTFHESNGAPERYERDARAEVQGPPLEDTFINDWKTSQLTYATELRNKASFVCSRAKPEPRNVLFPLSLYAPSNGFAGGAAALVTGTSVRRGPEIDVWIRTSLFKAEPIITNGAPFIVEGIVQTRRVATGGYSLGRTAFNCDSRQMGVYESVNYQEASAQPTTERILRERLKLTDVVPSSVGESQLESICRIYGR